MGVVGVDTDTDAGTGDAGTEAEADTATRGETEMGDTRPLRPSPCPSLVSMSWPMDARSRVALSGSGTSSTSGHDTDAGGCAGKALDTDTRLGLAVVSQCSGSVALRLDGGGVAARRFLGCGACACASEAATGTSARMSVAAVGLPLRGVVGGDSCETDMVMVIAIVGTGADWCRSAVFSLRVRAAMAGCTGGECADERVGSVVVCVVGVANGDGLTGEPDVGICDSGERDAEDDGAFHTTDGDGRSARGVPLAGAGSVIGLDGVAGVGGVIGLGVTGVFRDDRFTWLAFAACAWRYACFSCWEFPNIRRGDFSGRYGRAEAGVTVEGMGDMAGSNGETGVSGLSSGTER